MTDPIKAKIHQLINKEHCVRCRNSGMDSFCMVDDCRCHDATLADVLRAIEKSNIGKSVCIGTDGSFCKGDSEKIAYWNLTTDYDGQTEEVKAFIGKLLVV